MKDEHEHQINLILADKSELLRSGQPFIYYREMTTLQKVSFYLLSDDYVPSVSVLSTTGSLSISASVSLFSLFISTEDVSFS